MLMQEDVKPQFKDTEGRTRYLSEEEYERRLHRIVPFGTRVVTARQAGAIWRLRALYEYGVPDAQYESHTARIKIQAKSIHKLTPEEQRRELGGAVIRHYDFLWLDEVLKVPLAPRRSILRPPKGMEAYRLLDTFIADRVSILDQVHDPGSYHEYAQQCEEKGVTPLSGRTFSRVLAKYRKLVAEEQGKPSDEP